MSTNNPNQNNSVPQNGACACTSCPGPVCGCGCQEASFDRGGWCCGSSCGCGAGCGCGGGGK
jgi:hypothetical protein